MRLKSFEGVFSKVIIVNAVLVAVAFVISAAVASPIAITVAASTLSSSKFFAPSSNNLSEFVLLIRIIIELGESERADKGLHTDSPDGIKEVTRT